MIREVTRGVAWRLPRPSPALRRARLSAYLPVGCLVASILPVFAYGQDAVPTSLVLSLLAIALRRHAVAQKIALLVVVAVVLEVLYRAISGPSAGQLLGLGEGSVAVTIAVVVWAVAAFEVLGHIDARLEAAAYLKHDVAEGFDMGVCVLDPRGCVEGANAVAERLLGWRTSELHGRHFLRALQAGDSDGWHLTSRVLARVPRRTDLPAEPRNEEFTVTVKTGERVCLSCVWLPIIERKRLRATVVSFRKISRDSRLLADLEANERTYRGMVESAELAMLTTDRDGHIIIANSKAIALMGGGRTSLAGLSLSDLAAPDDRQIVETRHTGLTPQQTNPAHAAVDTVRVTRHDGKRIRLEISTSPLATESEDEAAILHVCRSTGEDEADERTRIAEMCTRVQNAASAALASATDLHGATTGFMQATSENSGWDLCIAWAVVEGETVMKPYASWHADTLETGMEGDLVRQHPVRRGHDLPGTAWSEMESIWAQDLEASHHTERTTALLQSGMRSCLAVPVRTGGRIVMLFEYFGRSPRTCEPELVQMLDNFATYIGQVVERTRAERVLEHQALHDGLTGLPNRVLLERRMQRAIGACLESRGGLSLLFLDLDRFKEVNDTLGHQVGDLLLQQVSARLRKVVRSSDTVARLGGDEFAVLLPASDEATAVRVAGDILKSLQQPYLIADQILDVGTSVGIAVYPEDGVDASALMRHADVAMYMAKRSQSGYARYCSSDDVNSRARLTLAAELRQAIEQCALELHYQPRVNLDTGSVQSVEALARWNHPERGMLLPSEFIPLAEASGLTRQITAWVLEEAIRQIRQWKRGGIDLRVAVNLFPQTLHDSDLFDNLSMLLDRYGVDPSLLTLEVTESAIMSDPEGSLEILRRFRDLGARISIDDFGTGYSSLLYLKRLPVHELKIDKSFVLDMVTQADDALIARSVIELGHNLGLQVIAEGVESPEVWGLLKQIGCDFVQGFYVSEAQPAPELVRWLASFEASEDQMQTA